MKARQHVRWPVGLVAAAAVVGTVGALPALLRQSSSESFAQEPAERARPGKTASVRIEHELITVDPEPTPRVAPSPLRATASVMRAAAPVTSATAPVLTRRPLLKKPQPTLAEKTRRALMGDGRHRPEPFPRVRQP